MRLPTIFSGNLFVSCLVDGVTFSAAAATIVDFLLAESSLGFPSAATFPSAAAVISVAAAAAVSAAALLLLALVPLRPSVDFGKYSRFSSLLLALLFRLLQVEVYPRIPL